MLHKKMLRHIFFTLTFFFVWQMGSLCTFFVTFTPNRFNIVLYQYVQLFKRIFTLIWPKLFRPWVNNYLRKHVGPEDPLLQRERTPPKSKKPEKTVSPLPGLLFKNSVYYTKINYKSTVYVCIDLCFNNISRFSWHFYRMSGILA